MAASRTPLGPSKLLFNVYRALVLRGWGGRGMKATTHLNLVPRLKFVELHVHSPTRVHVVVTLTWIDGCLYLIKLAMLHIWRLLVFAVPQSRGTNTNVHQRLQRKMYSLVKGRRYEHTLPVRGFAHCSVAYSRRTVMAKLEHRGVGPSHLWGPAAHRTHSAAIQISRDKECS